MAQDQATRNTRAAAERDTSYPGTKHAAASVAGPVTAHATATLGMLAGLWVAISPWVLTMPAVATHNAIVGLAVAAFGLLALAGSRGFASLQAASLLTGVWVLISPWLLGLSGTVPVAAYWSNVIAGAVIVVLSVASGGVAGMSALRPGGRG